MLLLQLWQTPEMSAKKKKRAFQRGICCLAKLKKQFHMSFLCLEVDCEKAAALKCLLLNARHILWGWVGIWFNLVLQK